MSHDLGAISFLAHVPIDGLVMAGISVGLVFVGVITGLIMTTRELKTEKARREESEGDKRVLKTISNYLQTPKGIRSSVEDLHTEAGDKRESVSKMKADIEQELEDIEAARREHEKVSIQQKSVIREWQEKLTAVKLLRAQLAPATKALEEEKQRGGELTQKIEHARREGWASEWKAREAEKDLARFIDEKAAAKKRCGEMTAMAEKLRPELTQAEDECRVAEQKHESVHGRLQDLTERKKRAVDEHRRAVSQCAELELSIKETKAEVKRLETKINRLKEAIKPIDREREDLEKQRKQVEGINADLETIREESKKLNGLGQKYPKLMKMATALRRAVQDAQEVA